MPTPPGSGPLLKWRVENERQVYGYIIYRADSEGGPTRRVNEKLIKPLSSEEGVPVDYKWRDTTAEPGRTYWYKIGTIDQRDDRKDLTGWAKKTYAADPGAAK